MNTHTQEMLKQLDESRAGLKAAVESVPEPSRDTRPAEGRWSVAEILEHIGIIDTNITRLWRDKSASAPEAEGEIAVSVDLSRVLDRSTRVQAREVVTPTGKLDWKSAYAEAEQARQKLREALIEADGSDVSGIVLPHPLLGRMNLYQWILFLGAHEKRHSDQIREIAS
jgi:hypothetical protein